MPLAPGQTLTHYEILGPIGAGGMGEVYRARDTRLEREVAIKVLPEGLADDEERLRRFEREAKTLASLNHPNVAGIHGVDHDGATYFLALELVPGEDLATRLARGRLPVDEAIDVCRQIAEGLEAAHEAGVVHRDLKPANVHVTPDGIVKLLDFGLAKPIRPRASGESGTTTAESDSFLLTEQGLVLGTPTYMSPEQARGKPVDRRTDIWAFGCVLYECLTGKRAYGGDSLTDVLASIVEREPDWAALPAATPAHVRTLLRRCLVKDPRARLRDVGEARVALAGVSEPEAVGRGRSWLPAFGAGALTAGVVCGALLLLREGRAVDPPARPLRAFHLAIERPDGGIPMLSPDGARIAYDGREGLMVRELAEAAAVCVLPRALLEPRTRLGCWSADGTALAFFRGDTLETLRLGDARAEPRCSVPTGERSVVWGDDGSLLVEVSGSTDVKGVFHLAPGAGELVHLDWIDMSRQFTPDRFWPAFLPGSKEFLLTIQTDDGPWIHVASLAARTCERVVRAATRSDYVPPGWLAWCDGDRLLVQPFDAATQRVSGSPKVLVEGVSGFVSRGDAWFDFSDEGTLFFRPIDGQRELDWVARGGRVLEPVLEPGDYGSPQLDPSGERLLLTIDNGHTGARDLWIRDLARGVSTRLTPPKRWVGSPAWSPDGTRVAFLADWKGPPHVFAQLVDGGAPEEIVPFDGSAHSLGCWTADGGAVIYGQRVDGEQVAWVVDLETKERRPLFQDSFEVRDPAVSPDGRWLAHASSETGRSEIYLATLHDTRRRVRVSTDGGWSPCWSRDGTELYYLSEEGILASAIGADGRVGDPDLVVPDAAGELISFDAAPDGQRFVVLRADQASREPPDRLVTSWERLLER